ncbi:MAG: hypothetical protein B7X92_10345 [Novosphingobium sp. 17-62-9]|nr:MAG: hypothetical protein B7Z36_02340 [Novosphingobium sp. 12-63-9]OZA34374.1 MAG: hypothetical protein B7X92_10345 [Novosphingobium sp. 17-62-9]
MNQTEQSILRGVTPAGWMYEREGQTFTSHNPGSIMFMESDGWTKKRLFDEDQLLAAVREAVAGKWLPIESAPVDTMITLYCPGMEPDVSVGCQDEEGWFMVEADLMQSRCHPVAWQPLPTAPQGDA